MYKLIILSFLFFAFLKFVTEDFNFSWEASAALVLIIIGGSFLSSPKKRRFLPIIILTLVSASHLIFLFTLKDEYLKNLCLGLFSIIFLLALAGINIFFNRRRQTREAEIKFPNLGLNLIKGVILVSVFLWTAGSYGLYLNLELPTHLLMLAILFNVIISVYSLLKISPAPQKTLSSFWFYPFLFGLTVIELVWVISFWPIGRLTAGAIILANYYIFWNILENRLRNSLNKKVIFSNILFLAAIIILLLSSSQWEIR